MKLRDWLREREMNARRIASGKQGEDRAGWLEDAEYFKRAAEAVDELERTEHGVCRVNRQSCDCPVATCKLSRGGLRPAGRVKRLQDAIEGECDGLAIDEQHARAILQYVDGMNAVAAPLVDWPAIHRGFASAAPAVEAAAARINEAAEALRNAGVKGLDRG